MTKRKKAAAVAPAMVSDDGWRARDDLRTLSTAAEIGRDKKRLKAAQAEAKKQMVALARVAGGKGSTSSSQERRKRLENVAL